MSKYRLGKLQIKRLIEGKSVVNGHGQKFYASENIVDTLKEIDTQNLYDELDIICDGRMIVIKDKVRN